MRRRSIHFKKIIWSELSKKLKAMSVKLVQESIAYMGCAAVHLKGLIDELNENEKELGSC